MAADFPTTIPSAGSAVTTDTLAAAGHTALHNDDRDNIRAIAQKIGTGAATPTANEVLVGDGVGTSTWSSSLSGLTLTSPTINTPTISSPSGLTKSDVGLGNVDNTSDATKNAASVTLTNKTIDADNNTISNISNNELSTTAGELGGAWDSWTATKTGITQGDGTYDYEKYIQVGNTVFFRWRFTYGTTSSFSAPVAITLPVTPHADIDGEFPMAQVVLSDAGSVYNGILVWDEGNTRATILRLREDDGAGGAANSPTHSVNISGSQPFSWTSGDQIIISGFYEAA